MSGKIKPIKAKDNNGIEQVIFPNTVLEAVVDSETNKTLDNIIDELRQGGGGGQLPEDIQEQIDSKVSKSGDTMTGALILEGGFDAKSEDTWLEQDYVVMQTREGKGQAGYWKFCTITTTQDNVGEPIKIYIAQLNTFGELTIAFNNVSTIIDCDVAYIRQTGNIPICYIKKTSGTEEACTFDVFATKSNIWDALTVTRFDMSWYIKQGVKLEWSDTFVDTLPDGVIASNRYNEEDRETFYALGGVSTVGDINAGGNLQQSLFSEHPENGLYPVPTSGGWDTAGVGNLFQDLSVAKTFLGSYSGAIDSEGHENTWHNVISVRHRNGVSDGNSYGMYIRSQLTNDQSLVYNKQYNGTWKGEKTILDSANYANYALPLTGGTVSGSTVFNGVTYLNNKHTYLPNGSACVHLTSDGTTGYWRFAQIKMASSATYSGGTISFKVRHRGGYGEVFLAINNSANAGTGFTVSFSQKGNMARCYIHQSSTGVFDLYLIRSSWDAVTISDLVFPKYTFERCDISWLNQQTSLPSGATPADITNEWSSFIETYTSNSISLSLETGMHYLIFAVNGNGMYFTETIISQPWTGSFNKFNGTGSGSISSAISGSTYTVTFSGTTDMGVRIYYIKIGVIKD